MGYGCGCKRFGGWGVQIPGIQYFIGYIHLIGQKMLNGKTVLVTGGSGTFGRAFIRHVLKHYKPRRLICFSRDEYKQWEMRKEFGEGRNGSPMRYFLGDVRDLDRLVMALRIVDIVIHAAALKHVPSGEANPMEVIKTNVIGAQNLVQAAIACKVEKVIALSTDKAVNPINLYGASKLCAEKLFIGANALSGENGTQFSVVRYGNVINSRGSVIELFSEQAKTGRITVTHPDMTRFFMRVEDSIRLVMDGLECMKGGEVFIPKIPSVKITALATAIGKGCALEFSGIRPGEKLHESLISQDDSRNTVEWNLGYCVLPEADWYERNPNLLYAPKWFSYTSDSNPRFMTAEEIQNMVREC